MAAQAAKAALAALPTSIRRQSAALDRITALEAGSSERQTEKLETGKLETDFWETEKFET